MYCVKTTMNQCAAYINIRVKRKPNKWINDSIKRKIEEREAIKTNLLNNKSNIEALLDYKDSKREISKQIRNTKVKIFS